jgi:hypothetical protein
VKCSPHRCRAAEKAWIFFNHFIGRFIKMAKSCMQDIYEKIRNGSEHREKY